ncbi:endonuclease/exonuclease/phosphatase family protein [Bdellovibrio sp. SKB1291214]|uniref:endonuclease/exonuclease/phosphatase family protein n=1 Tax=Bdellovibrio sp. SKB1291214 TaxID=1732569 RepID=UPI0015961DB0|nr:endonuclease/exonuclease/phosphatase family protein [Bdellovibrio sp. SKB1291214]UYL08033.1 endonuclease/exonuclease/phosphatase family protein [Bdellovibrio sp. SKB1291214]
MTIRIVTYNIHGAKGIDGRRDYLRIGLFLKHHNIDVALIQEMDTRTGSDPIRDIQELKTDHFKYFVAAPTMEREKGWYGNAILSRFPVFSHKIMDISSPDREPRNIVEAFLETPKGLLHVINTHKGLKIAERNLQMKKLFDFVTGDSSHPLIVGGDINEWQSYSANLKRLNNVLHAVPSGNTFPTRAPFLKLDRMWCRPPSLVRESMVLKTSDSKYFSDHYPLLAEIQMI